MSPLGFSRTPCSLPRPHIIPSIEHGHFHGSFLLPRSPRCCSFDRRDSPNIIFIRLHVLLEHTLWLCTEKREEEEEEEEANNQAYRSTFNNCNLFLHIRPLYGYGLTVNNGPGSATVFFFAIAEARMFVLAVWFGCLFMGSMPQNQKRKKSKRYQASVVIIMGRKMPRRPRDITSKFIKKA